MLDPIDFLVSALVLAVAAFTIAAIGFGFGLTITPILLLYLDPQTVVVVVNAVAILAFGLMLFGSRRYHSCWTQTSETISSESWTSEQAVAMNQSAIS